MATLKPLPQPQVPLIDPATGRITTDWFLYFQSRERIGIANLSDVSNTAPADTETLIFNASTGKWTPGAN